MTTQKFPVLMTGEIKPGLYRLFDKKKRIRFFKIHFSTQGTAVVKEYRNGDLHSVIKETRSSAYGKRLWPKLTTWQ